MNDYSSLLTRVCQGKILDLIIELCPDNILEIIDSHLKMF
jgi:hypothetical protein